MKKAKERLEAEAKHPMTRKQRWDNFWFYYRWWVIGGAAALSLVVMFISDIVTQVSPDYQLGLLTPGYVSEGTVQELEQLVTGYVDDRNGDGKTVVAVMLYNMAVGGQEAADPMAQMAGVTRLAADLQSSEGMLFLTDYPLEYHQGGEMFAYNDGTLPPEGAIPDDSRLGVPLVDCPAFAGFLAGERMEDMTGYRLVKRAVLPSEKRDGFVESKKAYDALFDKLTQ